MKARLAVLALVLVAALTPAHADQAAAQRFYEDGLARFERGDLAGAVVQLKNALQQDRSMLAAQLLLARAYLRDGDVGPAEVAFNEALRLGVSRSEVAVPLARIYLVLGKPAELIDKISPSALPADIAMEVYSLRGTAFAALGRLDEASRSFARARELAPGSALPLIEEVPVLIGAGRLDEAAERAEAAVALAPGESGAWNALASVAHARRDAEAALSAYARALERAPGSLEVLIARAGLLADLGRDAEAAAELAQAGAAGERDPRAAYLAALLATRRGDSAAANAALERVAALIETLPPAWLEGKEQLLMLGALSNHGLGRIERARSYLDLLSRRYPRNAGGRRLYASVLIEAGEYARARSLLDEVLRTYPNDAETLFLLGRVMHALRRHDQAVVFFDRALEAGAANPLRIEAALGVSQLASGQVASALDWLERVEREGAADPLLASALASAHLRRGDAAKAQAVSERLLRTHPDDAITHNLAGVVAGSAGDLSAAAAAYEQALRLDGTLASAQLNLARVRAAQGQYDAARELLTAMVARDRKNVSAMFELGRTEAAAGRRPEAIDWLDKAFAEFPASPRVGIALTDLLLADGDRSRALDVARGVATRHAGDLDALAALARAQLAVGDSAAARQSLREMGRLSGFDGDSLLRVGRMQLQAGDAEEAGYTAHKALTTRPDDPAARMLAIEAALALGRPDEADPHLAVLASDAERQPEVERLRGDVAQARGEFDAADAAYARSYVLQPDASLVLRRVGALLRAGRAGEALKVCEAHLQAHPDSAELRGAVAELHMLARDWARAVAAYRDMLARGQSSAALHNNLANALDRLGDPAAVEHARTAHALDPGNPFVSDTLGWLLVRTGALDEGLRLLRDARLRAPDMPELRYHLGDALARSGRRDEARRELEAALAMGSEFEGRDQAKALLARLRDGG